MLKRCRLFFLSLLILLPCLAATEEAKNPRITLEEMEIVLLKDGRVLRRMGFSKEDGMRYVPAKGDGVTTEKRFIDPAVLTFFGDDGLPIRQMVLKRPGKETRSNSGDWKETVRESGVADATSRDAVVSADGQYALVTEYLAGTRKGAGQERFTHSTIRLYDSSAHPLWEETTPDNTYVNKIALSEGGGVAAYIEVAERRGDGNPVKNRLTVFDREKKQILRFPDDDGNTCEVKSTFLALSPDGRYAAAATKCGEEMRTLYFDLNAKTHREEAAVPYPVRIDGSGKVYLMRPGRQGEEELLDLQATTRK